MASQTVMTFYTSSTPKLTTFNSPTPTLLPLPPPPTLSCFSSLPVPCLKASYGGIRALNTSNFKCYAAAETDATPFRTWEDIKDAETNTEVQSLARFAVEERNKRERPPITVWSIVGAEMQVAAAGVNYRLLIKGRVDETDKVFKAVVFVGATVFPKDVKSFAEV